MTAQTTEAPPPLVFTCRTSYCIRLMPASTGHGCGYCAPCYKRWWRAGFPDGGPPPPQFARPDSAAASTAAEPTTRELAALLAQGRSHNEVASRLGLSRRTVTAAAAALYGSRAREAASPGPASSGPACRGMNPVLFFGRDGERQDERQIRELQAKKVCAACPVRSGCLDTAMTRPEKHGVWGGLNEDERAAVKARLYQDRKNASRRVAARREQDELAEAS